MKRKLQAGITYIEIMIGLAMFSLLLTLTTINFPSLVQKASLDATVLTTVSDIKDQQLKAMVGADNTDGNFLPFGVYFESDKYTLFRGSIYDPLNGTNFVIGLGDPIRFSTVSYNTLYLGDQPWVSATGGYGPVERNKSNGENAAGDGNTITLNGVTYTSGLGTHSYSEIHYNIAGNCSLFNSDIGIDDEVGSNGSIIFQVFADGIKLYDSGTMTGSTQTQSITDLTISGKQDLSLVVTDAGDGGNYDHADWANARIKCTASVSATQIIFSARNGEIQGFSGTQNSITLVNTVTNQQKTIYFNKVGVVTGIN